MVECPTGDRLCLQLASTDGIEEPPAPYEASAPGLAEAMGMGANALAGRFELFATLSELEEKGLVTERSAVVEGLDEQRRVYELTDDGQTYARDLEGRLAEQEVMVKTGDGTETMSLGAAADRLGSLANAIANLEGDVLVLEDDIEGATDPEAEPFVDRDDELDWLEGQFDHPFETPSVALVSGEPGVGKTKLVDVFADRVREEGGVVLSGRCQSNANEPYSALRDALEDLPESEDLEALFSTQQDVDSLDPEELDARRQSLFTEVAERLGSVAEDRPLVLFLDDATLMQQPDAMLFAHVLEELQGRDCLAVVAFRPEGRAGSDLETALANADTETVKLDPLPRPETTELVCRLVGTRRVPESFTETVQEHTGGNPLFITECISRMLEDGVVQPTAGIYPDSTDDLQVPDTVAESITDRLGALDDATRELLDLASLVGVVVPDRVLENASNLEKAAFRERVELLVKSRLWDREDDRTIRFASPVVREAIRDEVADERTQRLHRRIARGYQEKQQSEQQAAAVAYHYEQAGESESAIEASLVAAEQASEVFAHETAIEACERALELARAEDDETAIIAALEQLGDTYQLLGEYDEARRCYRYVIDETETAETLQRMYRKEGEVARNQAEYDDALSALERGLDIEGTPQGEADIRNELGWVTRVQSEFEAARDHVESALDTYEEIGDRRGQAEALKNLGTVALRLGEFGRSRRRYQQSLDRYQEIGDRYGVSQSLNNLAIIAWQTDNMDTAREHFQESLDISRDIDDTHGEAKTLNNLGLVERREENLAAAKEYLEDSIDICERIGARYGIALSEHNLGTIAIKEGEYDAAHEYVTRSLAIFKDLGDEEFVAKSQGLLGLLELVDGNVQEGREQLSDALDQLRDLGAIPTGLELLRYHLEVELDRGDESRARDLYETAESLFAEMEMSVSYEWEQIESLCADLE